MSRTWETGIAANDPEVGRILDKIPTNEDISEHIGKVKERIVESVKCVYTKEYEGNFENGKEHGKGIFYKKDKDLKQNFLLK